MMLAASALLAVKRAASLPLRSGKVKPQRCRMSKKQIFKKYLKLNRLIAEAEKNGNYRERQELERKQIKILDTYFMKFIMPHLTDTETLKRTVK